MSGSKGVNETMRATVPVATSKRVDAMARVKDFDRVQKAAKSEQELFDQMTALYPHWVANQSWLMFGFPQP
jgi:hypothetical protein